MALLSCSQYSNESNRYDSAWLLAYLHIPSTGTFWDYSFCIAFV
jgi:hypothetical protein